MPDVKYLPAPRVNPYAGENTKAFMSMVNILASTEAVRRKKFMTDNILEAIARGGRQKEISQAALMEPGFSSGIPGIIQRIASPFAQQTTGIDDIIAGRGIESAFARPNIGAQPWASTQMSPAQTQNWLDNYGRSVTIQTGQKRLTEEERDARARAEHDKIMGKTGPGFGPGDKKAIGEEMDTALDSSRRGFWTRPGRANYTEAALFKGWQDFIAKNTFENDNQRENTWAAWKQKVNQRNKEGWFGNEVEWDPTDQKWREAIGLKAEGKTPEFSNTLDALNQAFRELPVEKKSAFDAAWKKAQKAGATAEEFLAELQK